jgi:hypothetical protein
MKTNSNAGSRWLTVAIFALAMAWVESAVVYYLRSLIHRIEPYQPNPLPVAGGFGFAEMVREAATMVMLSMVGILAGRNWRSRLGYAAIAFGVWDIFYYVFLKVMCGWPHSLLDWDILFLLPLPWWGPVLAPVSIALLMILWGTLVSSWQIERARDGSEWKVWGLNFFGVILALYLFMQDSIRVANQGVDALRNLLPQSFQWPLFCVALPLMAAPIFQVLWRLRQQRVRRQQSDFGAGVVKRTVRSPSWSRLAGPVALNHERWINHFIRNRENRPEPDWSMPICVLPHDMESLLRSLAQFQLGDGGGPASLIARDAERFRGSTPEMRRLVDLWFTEEREHSRLLGCAVDALGGKRIESHWSFTAFCQCRRVLGVRFELQVLLLTEITSTCYYRLLQRHCKIAALEDMCGLILRDEGGHVSFHRERLIGSGRATRGLGGLLWSSQFRLCGYAAATMLWANHRRCLKGLGATDKEFYREVSHELNRFLRSLSTRSELQSVRQGEAAKSTQLAVAE